MAEYPPLRTAPPTETLEPIDGQTDALELLEEPSVIKALRDIQRKVAAELADAEPPNWEEDNYDAGYINGLNFVDDLLLEAIHGLEDDE